MKYALDNGMIDLAYVQEQIEMKTRKELLSQHIYKIWKGKDDKWYTYLPDEQKGRILKKRISKDLIEDEIVNFYKSKLENPRIDEVFEEWNDRRLELQKISKATHLRNGQIYNRHFKEFGKRKIKNIGAEEILEFLEEQIPKFQLTSKAFSNLKTLTKGFLKRAKRRKLIDLDIENIFNELDTSDSNFKKVIKEDYEEVFNDQEMHTMIQYLENNLDITNLGILLMFVTGARIGEVVALKHEDIFENTIKIRRTETRYLDSDQKYIYDIKDFPKSQAGVRTAIIPNDFLWIMKPLKLNNPFSEFIFMKNGKRIQTTAMRSRLRYICRKLGIYQKSPHKIRKTYGSILLDNHIDNRLILDQMGHTTITCTENHYHRNRRNLSVKAKILSDIPEFKDKNGKTMVDYF